MACHTQPARSSSSTVTRRELSEGDSFRVPMQRPRTRPREAGTSVVPSLSARMPTTRTPASSGCPHTPQAGHTPSKHSLPAGGHTFKPALFTGVRGSSGRLGPGVETYDLTVPCREGELLTGHLRGAVGHTQRSGIQHSRDALPSCTARGAKEAATERRVRIACVSGAAAEGVHRNRSHGSGPRSFHKVGGQSASLPEYPAAYSTSPNSDCSVRQAPVRGDSPLSLRRRLRESFWHAHTSRASNFLTHREIRPPH